MSAQEHGSQCTACTAYTKEHIQCRQHAKPNTPYCAIHRNYARDWFATHPPLYGIYSDSMISNSRVVKEYIAQFRSGAIVPTRAYVYNLPDKHTSYFYYILLCENCPTVNPLWNKNLFKSIIGYYFIGSITSIKKADEFGNICTILGKNTECLLYMYERITYYVLKYILRYKFIIPYIDSQMIRIIESVLELECWDHMGLADAMNQVIQEHRAGLDFYNASGRLDQDDYAYLTHIINNILVPAHQTWRSSVMAKAKSRIEPYVDDLIAAAWHPRRVERWIEVLGLEDVFDVL